MANDLTAIKTLVAFVFKTKNQLTGYLEDGKITWFEGIGIAAIASEAVPLVKDTLPKVKGTKLTVSDVSEIVNYVCNEFSLPKNKALEAQIKLSVKWAQSTLDLVNGWKSLKS